MKRADTAIKNAGLSPYVKLILQIHDELIFEIKEEKIEEAMKVIKDAMEDVIPRDFKENMEDVPLVVSASYGKNWGELK
jgi:DNA polymerase-1